MTVEPYDVSALIGLRHAPEPVTTSSEDARFEGGHERPTLDSTDSE